MSSNRSFLRNKKFLKVYKEKIIYDNYVSKVYYIPGLRILLNQEQLEIYIFKNTREKLRIFFKIEKEEISLSYRNFKNNKWSAMLSAASLDEIESRIHIKLNKDLVSDINNTLLIYKLMSTAKKSIFDLYPKE